MSGLDEIRHVNYNTSLVVIFLITYKIRTQKYSVKFKYSDYSDHLYHQYHGIKVYTFTAILLSSIPIPHTQK